MQNERRLDEQVISQAIQAGLSSQLEEADTIQVDVHTDVLKAVQGQADSVSMSGQGLTVQDIRMEELEVEADHVAIDPLSLLFGKVELNQPLNMKARVTLTEADVNRALNSETIAKKIPTLTLNVAGQTVPVELQLPLAVKLPGPGKVSLNGEARLHESAGTRLIGFSVTLYPRTQERAMLLESFHCRPGEGIGLEFAIELMQKFKQILDEPYLEWEGVAFRVQEMEVQSGSLTIQSEAYVRQIPSLE